MTIFPKTGSVVVASMMTFDGQAAVPGMAGMQPELLPQPAANNARQVARIKRMSV